MQPGRLGKTQIAVMTVIDEELEAACSALDATARIPQTMHFHGSGGPERFVVTKMADRGNVPAMEATRELIELWRPDVVLLCGIAGALASGDAWLGDVVAPDFLHYAEFRKLTSGADDLRFATYDHPTVSLRMNILEAVSWDGLWRERVTVERPGEDRPPEGHEDRPECVVGALVAGEKVVGDPDHPEQERLFTTFENATAVDMESFGVARAVHAARSDPDYNPRLAIVRGISDMVHRTRRAEDDERAEITDNHDQRRRWKLYAAATAAAFTAAVVEELSQ